MRPELTTTVSDFINSSPSNSITYENTSYLDKFSDITMVSYNVLNDYIDELVDLSLTVTLTDEEYNRYIFRPKLLAYDLYGSTELYFIIMMLNNICNVKEFTFKKVKLLKVDDLEKVISSIFNSEKSLLSLNRSKLEEI